MQNSIIYEGALGLISLHNKEKKISLISRGSLAASCFIKPATTA